MRTWGTTAQERQRPFPCDPYLPESADAYFRGVTVRAPAASVFRWLCQLKVAPYSYDWIDNFGRRSPRHLVPGVDDLEVGQRVMTIFTLVDFERDRHLTALLRGHPVFGEVAATYLVVPDGPGRCRLLVKLLVTYPRPALLGRLVRLLLPAGDWVMMRRQLLNIKGLAESATPSSASSGRPA